MTTTSNFAGLQPIRLQTSRAWRTYLGGSMISALHGEAGEDDHFPEEWLMSTVCARNAGREHIVEGITCIAGTEETLAQRIEQNPEAMMGKAHTHRFGTSPGVLVKLLDAAERLTLQVHPTREKARILFNSPFGKTECWHILGCRTLGGEEPCIYLGFREGITREYWQKVFDAQDIPAMLDCLHRIPVRQGDTFIIRGGIPHCIGAGCFLVEIQEPTDYTVRTERTTPSGLQVADFMCHQGLGFQRMFDCFTYEGLSLVDTLAAYRVVPEEETRPGCLVKRIIYPAVTDMFRLELVTVADHARFREEAFYGIYVLEGEGTLNGQPLRKCDHFFIPAACEDVEIIAGSQAITFLRCFGPV